MTGTNINITLCAPGLHERDTSEWLQTPQHMQHIIRNYTHIRWIHNQIKRIPADHHHPTHNMANHSSVKIKLHRDGRHVSLLYVICYLLCVRQMNELQKITTIRICGAPEFEFAKRGTEASIYYKKKIWENVVGRYVICVHSLLSRKIWMHTVELHKYC